jgi:hypothetical protein
VPIEPAYSQIIDALVDGRLVPFLGAGVHRCNRAADYTKDLADPRFVPDGKELANALIQDYWHVVKEHDDLSRVSQFVMNEVGDGALYQNLRQIFNKAIPATPIHDFLATAWPRARAAHYVPDHPLIMTTNYDCAMEETFEKNGQPCDVVYYKADGPNRGRFFHMPHGSVDRSIPILDPDNYTDVSFKDGPVVLKLHGALERLTEAAAKESPDKIDSFVIAEDHYLAYLTGQNVKDLLPVTIRERLTRCHFLFLGYGLRDWNLRVMMHQIATKRLRQFYSWAIQRKVDPLDERIWRERKVHLLDVDLLVFVKGLEITLARRIANPGPL